MSGGGRFKGRVAIVTGGSSGIGLACATELLREGAKVCITTLLRDAGVALKQIDADLGHPDADGRAMELAGDMADAAFCEKVVRDTVERFGAVHHLVNNAFSFNAKGIDACDADWDLVLRVGPVAYARMTQLVAKSIIAAGGRGSVVNVSSVSAHIAQPNRWTYNAAKGAVDQLTKCSALDLAQKAGGIRVNSVSPAWVWTREVAKAAGGDRAKWEPVWGDFHMLGRLCDPVEVAHPVLFLLSDEASFITGTDLRVDGGYLGLGPEGLGKSSKFAGTD